MREKSGGVVSSATLGRLNGSGAYTKESKPWQFRRARLCAKACVSDKPVIGSWHEHGPMACPVGGGVLDGGGC